MADEDVTEAQQQDSAGMRLRQAREAAGLSLADVAARTKIAERHLRSIEEGNYGALASRAYAVGFSRSFARAVGLDDKEIAQVVREELGLADHYEDRHTGSTFDPGDPARVPSAKVALLAALAGLLVVVAGYFLWRSHYVPAANLPSLADEDAAKAAAEAKAKADAAAAAAVPAAAVQPAGGAVTFTALEQGIWVKFYDGAGKQLMQKQMAQGESYPVPGDVAEPKLGTGRPEALAIPTGGKPVRKLSETQVTMKDIGVSAAALLARPPVVAAPVPASAPAAAPAVPPASNPSTVSR